MDERAFNELDLAAIDRFIAEKQEEHLRLDFKTLGGADLSSRDDRKSLAEAISGFAPADGGVIVWGVDARQNPEGLDCPVGKREIDPLSMFMAKLNQYTGDATTATVDGVRHVRLPIDDDRSFAATFVPARESA